MIKLNRLLCRLVSKSFDLLEYVFNKHFFGKKMFQSYFERLHRIAIHGMNFGIGDKVSSSGERNVFIRLFSEKDKTFVVFDVGANVGTYAIEILNTIKNLELYCFEPSLEAFLRLEENLHNYGNVKTFNIGFGEKNEIVTLYSDSKASGLASIIKRRLDHFGIEMGLSERVCLKKLDDYCKENNILHIDLLKIDTEGNEFNILNGAKQMLDAQSIDFIQFEFGGCNIDSRTFFQDFFYLLNPKYHIYRILQDGLIPIDKYKETHEIFITTNYVAISRGFEQKNKK